ncbi:MAG: hypothetical protein OEV94_07065 [Deltaproteobacteria bacterium]|nr:hypothetical protein [Deltaproteobacteria bacterium]
MNTSSSRSSRSSHWFLFALVVGCLIVLAPGARAEKPTAAKPSAAKPAGTNDALEAFALEDGKAAYKATRTIRVNNGVVEERTEYQSLTGEKIFTLSADYREDNLELVSYRTEDLRLGRVEEARSEGKQLVLKFQKKKGAGLKTESIDKAPQQIVGGQLAPFIKKNWDSLLAGNTLEVNLIVASRLETLVFRMKYMGEETVAGRKAAVFQVEPSSWIIRKLVNPMKYYISKDEERKILEYRGRGLVPTAEGDNLDVRVVYH